MASPDDNLTVGASRPRSPSATGRPQRAVGTQGLAEPGRSAYVGEYFGRVDRLRTVIHPVGGQLQLPEQIRGEQRTERLPRPDTTVAVRIAAAAPDLKPGVFCDAPGLAFEERRFAQTQTKPPGHGVGLIHAIRPGKSRRAAGRQPRSEGPVTRRRPAADRE